MPNTGDLLIKTATTAWEGGDLDAALHFMGRALETDAAGTALHLLPGLLADRGDLRQARDMLITMIARDPANARAQAQLARILCIEERRNDVRAADEIETRREQLRRMSQELSTHPDLMPGRFWDDIAARHERMLDEFGYANMKRTVSHAYQNWLFLAKNQSYVDRLISIWRSDFSPQPILNKVEAADDIGFNWRVSVPQYPLSDAKWLHKYKLAVGILWEYALSRDEFGFLEGFEESPIGNPIRITRDGVLISQDAAQSSLELNALMAHGGLDAGRPLVFGELGAGWGRLAEMASLRLDCRYLIFDIPPALAVSQWYAGQRFGEDRVFAFRPFRAFAEIEAELESKRIAFFTPNQMSLFPDRYVDAFVNSCSLMEMTRYQIGFYLDQISRLARTSFLSRQWKTWTNEMDGQSVSKEDFALRPPFAPAYDEEDPTYPDLFVQVWRRGEEMA